VKGKEFLGGFWEEKKNVIEEEAERNVHKDQKFLKGRAEGTI